MKLSVDFNLYLITDRLNLPAGISLISQVESALRGGVRGVQLREKDLAFDELLPLAKEMRALTLRYDATLLINRDIDIALAVEADGVHLGGDALTVSAARKRLGPARLIGVSTHALEEVRRAAEDGADFVTFGPVYATPSKEPYGAPLGLERLHEVVEELGALMPVFALGGMSRTRLHEVIDAGCQNVACIGAILFAKSAEEEARSILEILSDC